MMNFDIDEVKKYILSSTIESKIYLGGDSERLLNNGVWYADYATVVVIHLDGKHGCKIFGEVTRERDYDQRLNKPSLRLMTEVTKVAQLYFQLVDVIGNRSCEIHLDLNPNERYGSSCVVSQAVGYIMGTCNMRPIVKPNSFAATIAADRFKDLAA
jgi:uncharacterized protein